MRFSRGVAAVFVLTATLGAAARAIAPARARPVAAASRPALDKIFEEWNRRDSPGCSLAVYENGRIAYERGYGMADLEHDVPISPETVFYVGSLSKQFTAMTAALAMQQGRLSVDDPIRKYLPELPAYADRITVRHLIHHTSGLRDYNTLLSIAGRRGDEAFDNLTVLRITARQKKLNFAPGDEYLYSNTGYTLLALIVERATGIPFAEFAAKNIFAPLGMKVTHYHTDESRLVRGRALAYGRTAGEIRLDTPSNERAGAGGVFTNVRDLLHWDENFYSAQVGGPTLIARLQSTGALNSGKTLDYAWGLQIGTYRGARIVEHGGSLGGYRAHLLRFPDHHFSVSALCNLGSIAPGTLARRVADVMLANVFKESPPGARPSDTTDAAGGSAAKRDSSGSGCAIRDNLRGYAGSYYSDEVDATFVVEVLGGTLNLHRDNGEAATLLVESSADAFRFRGMTIRFERGPNGAPAALLVDAGRVRDIRFVRRTGS